MMILKQNKIITDEVLSQFNTFRLSFDTDDFLQKKDHSSLLLSDLYNYRIIGDIPSALRLDVSQKDVIIRVVLSVNPESRYGVLGHGRSLRPRHHTRSLQP
jgi:hypothetical protein